MRNNYFRDIASLYQDGAVVESKPKKRIFIASVYDDEPDTFIKEARAAGELSKAQGVPFEIITVKSDEDWNKKVKPLVGKSKGKGVQWGIFGHTSNYGEYADVATVDDIISDADEVFLGSCSGLYCARELPKTKEKSKLFTNFGALFTGVPRFKDYKSKLKEVQESNPNEDPFLSLLYGNDPEYRFTGPAKKGSEYVDWTTFNPENLSEEERDRLARLRALSEMRHIASVRGEERPTELPAGYVLEEPQRRRILWELGLSNEFPENQRVSPTNNRELYEISNLGDVIFQGDPWGQPEIELLGKWLQNPQNFEFETGIPFQDAIRFYNAVTSPQEYDSLNPLQSRMQIDTSSMYRNAMRPPQLSGVQNRKIGGIVLRK